MKALSYFFAFLGIFFLLLGIAFLTSNEPTAKTERLFFICFFVGMVSVVCFLATDKSIKSNN